MPTDNPRLNITLQPDIAALLTRLAKKENKSVSSMAKDLVIDALERREDVMLSLLAEQREKSQKGKSVRTAAEAWGDA